MTMNGIDRSSSAGGSASPRAAFVEAFLDADTLEEAYAALDISELDNVESVIDHEAVGDGVADDTAAINAFLVAADDT